MVEIFGLSLRRGMGGGGWADCMQHKEAPYLRTAGNACGLGGGAALGRWHCAGWGGAGGAESGGLGRG